MIEITREIISPEKYITQVKDNASGCVVCYVGLIRDNAKDKSVKSVEYSDPKGTAHNNLVKIEQEILKRWPLHKVAICHRIGKLNVNDINLVVAISCGHRVEGFAASQYVIDQFKEQLPTAKIETYQDDTSISLEQL